MSKKSASEFVKKFSPKNVSGSIPQALDLIKQLKTVDGMKNPKMPDSVGIAGLIGMLKQVQSMFNPPEKKKQVEEQLKMKPEAKLKAELLAQLAEIQKELADIAATEQLAKDQGIKP